MGHQRQQEMRSHQPAAGPASRLLRHPHELRSNQDRQIVGHAHHPGNRQHGNRLRPRQPPAPTSRQDEQAQRADQEQIGGDDQRQQQAGEHSQPRPPPQFPLRQLVGTSRGQHREQERKRIAAELVDLRRQHRARRQQQRREHGHPLPQATPPVPQDRHHGQNAEDQRGQPQHRLDQRKPDQTHPDPRDGREQDMVVRDGVVPEDAGDPPALPAHHELDQRHHLVVPQVGLHPARDPRQQHGHDQQPDRPRRERSRSVLSRRWRGGSARFVCHARTPSRTSSG